MGKMEWQPLTDIWETYNASLDEAVNEGYIHDPTLAEGYVWPSDLGLSDGEQENIKLYVEERMGEIVERIKTEKGLDPNLVAAYLFRSIICGLMWERERIGR